MRVPAESVVDRKHENANKQSNGCGDVRNPAFRACGRSRAGCGIYFGVVNGLEQRLVEVAFFVGVRIEEEALRATFHLHVRGQNLKGFLRMRPVFLRIELTFESSFFGGG